MQTKSDHAQPSRTNTKDFPGIILATSLKTPGSASAAVRLVHSEINKTGKNTE